MITLFLAAFSAVTALAAGEIPLCLLACAMTYAQYEQVRGL